MPMVHSERDQRYNMTTVRSQRQRKSIVDRHPNKQVYCQIKSPLNVMYCAMNASNYTILDYVSKVHNLDQENHTIEMTKADSKQGYISVLEFFLKSA